MPQGAPAEDVSNPRMERLEIENEELKEKVRRDAIDAVSLLSRCQVQALTAMLEVCDVGRQDGQARDKNEHIEALTMQLIQAKVLTLLLSWWCPD